MVLTIKSGRCAIEQERGHPPSPGRPELLDRSWLLDGPLHRESSSASSISCMEARRDRWYRGCGLANEGRGPKPTRARSMGGSRL